MNMLDTAVAITARNAGLGEVQRHEMLDPNIIKKLGDLAQKIWANEATWGDKMMFKELCDQNNINPDDMFPAGTEEMYQGNQEGGYYDTTDVDMGDVGNIGNVGEILNGGY